MDGATPEPAPVAVPGVRHRHRRRRLILTASALVVLGAAGAAVIGFGGRTQAARTTADAPPATATVTRQNLLDTQMVSGELGHGPERSPANRLPGTVTWLPEPGTVVGRGQPLYSVDNTPVVLLYGNLPSYRDLGEGAEGADVRELKENLRALGYRGVVVDEKFTPATAAAVKKWQKSLRLPETGRVELGRVVYTPAEVRVATLKAGVGAPVGPGEAVLTYSGTTRLVTVDLQVKDQRLAVPGAAVTIVLPDGKRTTGKITGSTTVIKPGAGQDAEPQTRIEVTVAADDQAALGTFEHAAVDVAFTAAERRGVLTVPVAALAALSEGGYGVQVVEGSSVRYLKVHTGLFAGGRVEVSGDGLAEGMTVEVPR